FLRSRDPAFVEPARHWFKEVGRVLGPQQITRGGPILMVQVENEYGYYGSDPDYVRTMRQAVLDAGFDVPLFACNPTSAVVKSHLPELFSVANFGSNPEAGFNALKEVQKGPLMCGEFYPGWFDTWGQPHHRGNTPVMLRDLDYMLKQNGSFSLYMAHGGTTFGLWAGCDRPFRPDTTSYDYDAPISEAGWTGEKFARIRELMKGHLLPGETLPEAPAPLPVIEIPAFTLAESAPVLANLPANAIDAATPQSLESYDISRGLVSYRTTLPAGPAGTLDAALVRDVAWVFLDGKPAGVMDTRFRRFRVDLPARDQPQQLELLLYTISRVNFGVEVHDRKGVHGPVRFTPKGGTPQPLEGWQIRAIDFDAEAKLPALAWQARPAPAKTPAFWRGTFDVATPGDTFLDVSTWGMGIVWINGRCLGRYWNIGPTQTMFLPAPWLKAGANEIVVLDLVGPESPTIAGVKTPVLDQLRPEKDFVDLGPRSNRGQLQLAGVAPTHAGVFEPGSGTQTVLFTTPVRGRQFCLESVDAFDGREFAAVAEIALLDAGGNVLNQSAWTIAYADSEEMSGENGVALNAINGQASDHWHTPWSTPEPRPAHPHRLIVDLGENVALTGFRYTPRQGGENVGGRIKTYRVYVGDKLVTLP
ncbi:MAG TPA: beta-galactosidase, partial [Opitutus sp.]|nr:beta-galactosidase [Opitutus sp.]